MVGGCTRITPAGAGKTVQRQLLPNKPHGSPPQVRGKPSALRALLASEEDHPRRCGENNSGLNVLKAVAGSPPQVRGKH